MKSLFEYLDYREFLRDLYEFRKQEKSWYSLRSMGSKLGMDASFLLRIMQKQEQLPLKKIQPIAKCLQFNKSETEYFSALVGFSRAKSNEQAALYFEKLMALKPINAFFLEPLQYQYYQKWYYSAVLSLVAFFPVDKNYLHLSRTLTPSISKKEAKEAIELLEKLGLITKNELGIYERSHRHISTGPQIKTLAVRKFQKEMIALSEQSLDRFPRELRDISTLTVNMKAETLEDIRKILSDCRQSITSRVSEDEETDCAYQINMQVFPLTVTPLSETSR